LPPFFKFNLYRYSEFAKAGAIVAAAPAPDTVAVALGTAPEVAAAAAAAAALPWRLLHAHQRAGVDWLAARHLAGVGGGCTSYKLNPVDRPTA
jgi:hypothetical protein